MEAKRCANPLLWEEYPIGSPVKSPPAFQRFADLKPKESHESLKNGNENEHYVEEMVPCETRLKTGVLEAINLFK